jgi:FkbM family methyltransferase
LENISIGEDKEVEFPVNEDSMGSSIYKTSGYKTIKVKSMSLTSILKEFKIKEPYLLDLDIEGAEFTVINDESVSKYRKVRIEYSPYLLDKQEKY